jgi:hypothetical protein
MLDGNYMRSHTAVVRPLISRPQALLDGVREEMHPLIDLPLRVLTVLIGGYVLTSLAAVALGAALSVTPADQPLLAVQISSTFYAVVTLWVFAVQSVWLGIGGLVVAGLFGAGLIIVIL